MHRPERNGDAHIPGLIVIAYEDVHRAVSFVPPDWRAGAGAGLERAPLSPVRLLDARELPEFTGEPRENREPTERFRPFTYDELTARDKVNLDITLVRDPSLDDADSL